ncbi:MAG: hypothetical protein PHI97_09850 [Desulfobulbus sp.]|nr:hypothetical protein [Desulfobulbus sp.]
MQGEVFKLGNTLPQHYTATLLGKHKSNLSRMIKEGQVRGVKVDGEKFPRVPLIDVLRLLQKEHIEITKRRQRIEQYISHLGNVYILFQEAIETPHKLNQDALNMVEWLKNNGGN